MNGSHSIHVTLNPDVLLQELEEEAVLLNLTDEHYFGLDETGLRFWQLLAEHGNSDDVIKTLSGEYEASQETLHKDLGIFIIELEKAGLLTITETE